jgi:hypothetical protein
MILGFAAGLTNDIDNRNIGSLNAMVMDVALPAALFTAMAQTPRAAMMGQARLAFVLLLVMLIVYGLAFAIEMRSFRMGQRESALLALTASRTKCRFSRASGDRGDIQPICLGVGGGRRCSCRDRRDASVSHVGGQEYDDNPPCASLTSGASSVPAMTTPGWTNVALRCAGLAAYRARRDARPTPQSIDEADT